MSGFQGVVIGLLLALLGLSYARGHDVRDDWSAVERVACALIVLAGLALVGVYAAVWAA